VKIEKSKAMGFDEAFKKAGEALSKHKSITDMTADIEAVKAVNEENEKYFSEQARLRDINIALKQKEKRVARDAKDKHYAAIAKVEKEKLERKTALDAERAIQEGRLNKAKAARANACKERDEAKRLRDAALDTCNRTAGTDAYDAASKAFREASIVFNKAQEHYEALGGV
jgi:hypothetical protein